MDPGIIELIATAGAGAVAGIGSYYLYTQSKDKKANVLSRNTIRKLGLDPNDKDIINIFISTKTKESQGRNYGGLESDSFDYKEWARRKQWCHQRPDERLENAFGNPLKNAARMGQRDPHRNWPCGKAQTYRNGNDELFNHLGSVCASIQETNLLEHHTTRWWKRITINAMTKRDGITIADDARLDEILKTAQKTLQLGQSNLDKAKEKYINRIV